MRIPMPKPSSKLLVFLSEGSYMKITSSLRVQCSSQEEAEQVKQWLEQQLGQAVHLIKPHPGRGTGVWFIRGTLQVEAEQQSSSSDQSVYK